MNAAFILPVPLLAAHVPVHQRHLPIMETAQIRKPFGCSWFLPSRLYNIELIQPYQWMPYW